MEGVGGFRGVARGGSTAGLHVGPSAAAVLSRSHPTDHDMATGTGLACFPGGPGSG